MGARQTASEGLLAAGLAADFVEEKPHLCKHNTYIFLLLLLINNY